MKLIIKQVISLLVILAVAYYGSAFVMPSIITVNNSGHTTEQMEVTWQSSNMNFEVLMNGEQNTLHYTLEQKDSVYRYKFKHENSTVYHGSCGDVTNIQIHKKVVMTLNKNNQVMCKTE